MPWSLSVRLKENSMFSWLFLLAFKDYAFAGIWKTYSVLAIKYHGSIASIAKFLSLKFPFINFLTLLEKQKKKEKDRLITLQVFAVAGKGPDQDSIWISYMGAMNPTTWTISCCLADYALIGGRIKPRQALTPKHSNTGHGWHRHYSTTVPNAQPSWPNSWILLEIHIEMIVPESIH